MAEKFFGLMEQISDYFFLNLLWLLCCIPVITIGAATTSMCYVCMKKARKEDVFVTKSFFKTFKANFVQATTVWVCILISLGMVYFLWSRIPGSSSVSYVAKGALAIVLFIACSLLSVYVFALIARYENSTLMTVKNSFLLAFTNPFDSIWLVGMILTPVIILYFLPNMGIILIVGGASGISRLMAGRYVKIFDKVQGD